MTDPAPSSAQPETVQEAQEQIDRTRQELGETVHALAEKADVKAQVRHKALEAKERAREKVEEAKARATDKVTAISNHKQDGTDPMGAVKQLMGKVLPATRANPQAALAIAFAVGWLLGRRSGPHRRRRRS
jgi:ElaB/YqjD/DUF883 family membrane-anchored ribosome-binding protein